MRRLALFAVLVTVTGCAGAGERLVIAAGTTVVGSGLMDHLASSYESTHPGVEVSVIAQPTLLGLELGRQRAVDMVVSHAPDLEAQFIAEGWSVSDEVVFHSRFVLVGPPAAGDRFAGWEGPEVLRMIAAAGDVFVGRRDGSGTAAVEELLWLEAGIDPQGADWYVVTGTGMGPTLQVTDQRGGYTLSEQGAFLAAVPTIELVDLEIDPEGLANPYRAMVVEGAAAESVALDFLLWLSGEDGRRAIAEASRAIFGADIYVPGPPS